MKALLLTFVSICLMRRGPEIVPTHPLFLGLVTLANAMASLLLLMQMQASVPVLGGLTYVFVTLVTSAFVVWFALYLRQLDNRFPATIGALFGCDLLLTSLSLALLPIFSAAGEGLTLLLVALVSIWSIAVAGYILHRALNVSVLAGILLALGVSLVSIGIGDLVVGSPG